MNQDKWWVRRWPVASEWMALIAALYFALVCNGAFWHAFAAAGAWGQPGAWRLAVGLFVGIVALHTALLLVLLNRWTTRIILPLLLLVTASAMYYMNQYRVYLDADMIRNVLATERKEASELLTPGLAWYVVIYGVVPSLLVWRTRPVQRSVLRGFLVHVAGIVLALVVAAGAIAASYQPMAAFMRNEKSIRHLITPGNWIVSLGKVLLGDAPRSGPKTRIGQGATLARPTGARPRVLVLAVGETVRAQNWGLNGYARQTTPQLAGLDGINYPDVTACGSNTEVSLPCMFSAQGLHDYDRGNIRDSESVLHLLTRLGIATLWRDNQTGCKGVCSDLPFESFLHANIPAYCDGERCLDGVLLDGLKSRIEAAPGDVVVVLHMLGNHGPAYYRRYPPEFRRYTPTCDTDQLAACQPEAIVNSYDNAILYTDDVLARTVAMLQTLAPSRDAALLYLSDHGESLGEDGVYLHGLPRAIAPDTQLKVPMWLWLSPQLQQADGVDMACLRRSATKPHTHDALFNTVLGLMRVDAKEYSPGQDLLAGCEHKPPAIGATGNTPQ